MKVITIFILSFLARLIAVFTLRSALSGDAQVYNSLGRSIADWGVFSIAMLSKFPLKDHPLYPLFIGINYTLFGENPFFICLLQSLIGAVFCILIYYIAKEYFDEKTALCSGIIAAFYPLFIKLNTMLLSENLFIFIFTFSLWLVIKFVKSSRFSFLALCGFALGLATLTRSVTILFIFLLSSYLFYHNKSYMGLKKNITYQLLFVLIFIFTILPWTIRNYYVSGGSIIPVTEAADRGLYNSFCPYKGKIFGIRPDDDPVMQEARKISSFKERRAFFFAKTLDFVKNNPGKVAKLEVLKLLYLWSPLDWEILGDGKATYNSGYVFILPFFLYGTFRLIATRKENYVLFFLPIFYFQIIHLVFFALPRFRLSFEPLLIIIGASGITYLYERSRQKKIFMAVTLIYLVFNLVLFMNSQQIKFFLRGACEKIGLW
ncbi:MAG: hypothetical protein DRP74_01865 [Candidatus Omnitrophota bacterium]|nr:MAG: hypothetical protein DRP74_01865 [Candidatus Omnitrophota bacterium]